MVLSVAAESNENSLKKTFPYRYNRVLKFALNFISLHEKSWAATVLAVVVMCILSCVGQN